MIFEVIVAINLYFVCKSKMFFLVWCQFQFFSIIIAWFYDREHFSEAVVQRCSLEEVFLKILQNSQKSTCVGVSFLIKFQALAVIKKRLQYRYFPLGTVYFVHFPSSHLELSPKNPIWSRLKLKVCSIVNVLKTFL